MARTLRPARAGGLPLLPRALSPSARAVLSAAAAASVAAGFVVSPTVGGAVVVALMAVFSVGWPQLVDLPVRVGRAVLLLLVEAGAVWAVLATGNLRFLAITGALGVIGAFVLELARRDGRPRLIDSLAASVTGVVVLLSGAAWLGMGPDPIALAVVVTSAGTLAAGAAVSAVHLPPWPHAFATIGAATLVGTGAAIALPDLSWVAVVIGAVAGLASASIKRVLDLYPPARQFLAGLAAAALPVVVAGLPTYGLLRYFIL